MKSSQGASHIFICYSSQDHAVAQGIVHVLEEHRLRCWISSRDVPPGQNYQETIVQALERAKAVVFLFSEASSASAEIRKELALAGSLNVPVFPLRLSPILPSGALRYELATRQWLDLFPDRAQAMRNLTDCIRAVVDRAMRESETDLNAVPSVLSNQAKEAAAVAAPVPAQKRTRKRRAPIMVAGSPEFEAIRALLARHIGPIAKVLVQKAAGEARSAEDFCERLAAHVTAPSERALFLQAVRARLAARA